MNIEFKDIENQLTALAGRIEKIGHMENIPVTFRMDFVLVR